MNLELLFSITISFNYSTVYDKNPIQKNGKTTVVQESQYWLCSLTKTKYITLNKLFTSEVVRCWCFVEKSS